MSFLRFQIQSSPLITLTSLFAAWKTLLLAIALGAAISPAYDTSTDLLFQRLSSASSSPNVSLIAQQLTRWDALYFLHATGEKGKVYEQEYAFGSALSHLIRLFSSGPSTAALAGIFIAHLSHLFSVLVIYRLTELVFPKKVEYAFTAAALHVISPAGLFLSSPYAEAPFSFLSFLGAYLLAKGQVSRATGVRAGLTLLAGAVWGVATWFRSNGLAGGLFFAVAAVQPLLQTPDLSGLIEVAAALVGGSFVAAGSAVPQFLAWQRYCVDSGPRPWCEKMVPSIYSFVQEHYW